MTSSNNKSFVLLNGRKIFEYPKYEGFIERYITNLNNIYHKDTDIITSMYTIYILRTSGNTLYVGQTNNLNKRLKQHKEKKVGAKYLRQFSSFSVVYTEDVQTKSEALKREYMLKKLNKKEKEHLINSVL